MAFNSVAKDPRGTVLMVCPAVPWPATQGTALRNARLVQALVSCGWVVDLLAFGETPEVRIAQVHGCRDVQVVSRPLRSRVRRFVDLLGGTPDLVGRLRSRPFEVQLRLMLSRTSYDVVQVEGFEVAEAVLGPRALRDEVWGRGVAGVAGRMPMVVFDDHNAEYQLQASASVVDRGQIRRWPRAIYSAVQAQRLRSREALYALAADLCVTVSTEDADALRAIAPGLAPRVVPNGVDVASFDGPTPDTRPTVVFTGKMDYRPNVDACRWFVLEILPLIRRAVPDVRVVLAGRDPAPAVVALATSDVAVTGGISDEAMRATLRTASVVVVPIRMGSGTRFKVLEAMAAGIPVVSTTFGASGSGMIDGVHGRLVDSTDGFANAVVALLHSPEMRARLAGSARNLAVARHDWSMITPILTHAYDQILAQRSPTTAVIATVRNEAATVGSLISGVVAQRPGAAQLVIVDGGSNDGTVTQIERALSATKSTISTTIEVMPGANISAGRNRALQRASAPLVAVVDAGTELVPGWLARLDAVLDQSPDVGVASGFFVAAPTTTWERALGATTLPAVEDIDPVRFLPSSRSVAFRRSLAEKVQGYPEWLDYGEDLIFDLALRHLGASFRFVPRAVVLFRPRTSVRAFALQYYRYARGDGKAGLFARRHAIRYGAYGSALLLGWTVRCGLPRSFAFLLVALGAFGYLRGPVRRLFSQTSSLPAALLALPLVPVVRVVGDVAKMAGYPVGLWSRWRAGAPPYDRRPPFVSA